MPPLSAQGGREPIECAQRGDRLAFEAPEGAVRKLDPRYREPLILRDVVGLSTAETAEVMGIGKAAFKSRLHRARPAVREAIEQYLGER